MHSSSLALGAASVLVCVALLAATGGAASPQQALHLAPTTQTQARPTLTQAPATTRGAPRVLQPRSEVMGAAAAQSEPGYSKATPPAALLNQPTPSAAAWTIPLLAVAAVLAGLFGWRQGRQSQVQGVLNPLDLDTPMRDTGAWAMATTSGYGGTSIDALRNELLRLAERSERGQTENTLDNSQVLDAVQKLEAMAPPTDTTARLDGEWELAWAGDDVTRSSPFFWAFRQAIPSNAATIFSITDAVPPQLKRIGKATQTIENSAGPGNGTLTSRVIVEAIPDAPVPLQSTMITTSAITERASNKITLKIQDTRVRDTTLPLWDLTPPFPSGRALDFVNNGASEVLMTTSYCDDLVRISRNPADGRTFVWRRV